MIFSRGSWLNLSTTCPELLSFNFLEKLSIFRRRINRIKMPEIRVVPLGLCFINSYFFTSVFWRNFIVGAGQEVGRSCVLVSIAGKNIMFDCGMHMGHNDEVLFNVLFVYSCFPVFLQFYIFNLANLARPISKRKLSDSGVLFFTFYIFKVSFVIFVFFSFVILMNKQTNVF